MGFFKKLFQSKSKKEKARKYQVGMNKTRDGALSQLKELIDGYDTLDERIFDDIEEVFIMADMGVNTVIKFVDHLRDSVSFDEINDAEALKEFIIDEMFKFYVKDDIVKSNLDVQKGRLNIILFVGVNGVGKTTTIGKVAHEYLEKGYKVLMVAGDTFRAGAIEQLEKWAEHVGADFYKKDAGSDPSSVMFDALKYAKDNEIDIVLCDTAGRLQNKKNLMMELKKIHRVIGREVEGAPHETLLVIDATTGQNGLSQANLFDEVTDLSGIVLTKLDGTAKGGIALAIKDAMDIPIKYVGLGEGLDDLEHFDIEEYMYGLFSGLF
jgi:fused signal recognition particle receptor